MILISLAGVWALPLAAWFYRDRKRDVDTIDWALLPNPPVLAGVETSPKLTQSGRSEPRLGVLRPGRAFWIGLIFAVIFAVLLVAGRLLLRLVLSEAMRNSDDFVYSLYIGMILSSGLISAAAGGLAALLIGRLSAIHGLFAAFVASAFSWLFFLIINLGFGGGLDLVFVWNTWSAMQSWGFLFALPVAILAGWVRGLYDGLRGRR